MDLQQLADSVGSISTFSIWFYFRFALGVVVVGWAAIKFNSWFFALLWNRGYDPKKHLLALKRIAAVIIVVIMALEILQAIHDHSPLLAVLLLVATLTIFVFAHRDAIANLTAGIAILVHNKIKIGYRITAHQPALGQVSGVVDTIDFLHTIVRLDDGGKALIPHRDVFSHTTVIEMEQPGYKVSAEVDCPKEALITTEKIEQMVRSLPYRKTKSPITVAIVHIGNPRRYRVTFFVWSPGVVTTASNSFYEGMASHINQQLKAKANKLAKPSKTTLASKAASKKAVTKNRPAT